MTKADIVADIAEETGLERAEALRAVEAFMNSIIEIIMPLCFKGPGKFWKLL